MVFKHSSVQLWFSSDTDTWCMSIIRLETCTQWSAHMHTVPHLSPVRPITHRLNNWDCYSCQCQPWCHRRMASRLHTQTHFSLMYFQPSTQQNDTGIKHNVLCRLDQLFAWTAPESGFDNQEFPVDRVEKVEENSLLTVTTSLAFSSCFSISRVFAHKPFHLFPFQKRFHSVLS